MTEVETPRKRKRESDKCIFTNAAFSSTPSKPIATARRLLKQQLPPQAAPRRSIKENSNPHPFFENAGLEIKSVAESASINPFEVVRKPPKKKKRDTMEEACFENAALNLEYPEKQFNPFEVLRTPVVPRQQCFINEALNIRGQEASAARNPYEIPRRVSNVALEDGGAGAPTQIEIGLPFTPTVGCRIDFKNISLSQLTPSRLLADKLVFSPVPPPKRSLDAVSEASTTLDIGKELDQYQLELENSINEAKIRRNFGCIALPENREIALSPELIIHTAAVEQKVVFAQKLTEIAEGEEDEEEQEGETENEGEVKLPHIVTETTVQLQEQQEETELKITAELKTKDTQSPQDEQQTNVADVAYASDSDEQDDDNDDDFFKAPARFVRAYRRDANTLTVSKESLHSVKSQKSNGSSVDTCEEQQKKAKNVKSLIRRSIRKLMHPLQNKDAAEHELPSQTEEKHNAAVNIINTLRHSLRRKPAKQLLVEDAEREQQCNGVEDRNGDEDDDDDVKKTCVDISIIDSSERTMKLKAQVPHMEYARIEELTNERKHSLRSSLRQSTRDMRNQLMRTVFHKKQETYAFCK